MPSALTYMMMGGWQRHLADTVAPRSQGRRSASALVLARAVHAGSMTPRPRSVTSADTSSRDPRTSGAQSGSHGRSAPAPASCRRARSSHGNDVQNAPARSAERPSVPRCRSDTRPRAGRRSARAGTSARSSAPFNRNGCARHTHPEHACRHLVSRHESRLCGLFSRRTDGSGDSAGSMSGVASRWTSLIHAGRSTSRSTASSTPTRRGGRATKRVTSSWPVVAGRSSGYRMLTSTPILMASPLTF